MRKLTDRQQWAAGALTAIVLAFVIDHWVLESILVPSASMNPTVIEGERLLTWKFFKWPLLHLMPKRFDVVVIDSKPLRHRIIKRIVALPGECVELDEGYKVKINGNSLALAQQETDEYYAEGNHIIRKYRDPNPALAFDTTYGKAPGFCLKDQEYYVLGDHRWRSSDSRVVGAIKREEIEGRAALIWLSVDKKSKKIRWNRIFKSID